MRDRVRKQTYRGRTAELTVTETNPGDIVVSIATSRGDFVNLDAETAERLGIDLQIRASYLRGVRPPPVVENDRAPGAGDVPLIEDGTHA